MIKLIQDLLKQTNLNSKNIKIAKGKYKYPSNIKEFKNYIKLR